MSRKIAAVLFDLDGTLVDTAGEIHAALARTLEEEHAPALPLPAVEALIGRGVRSLVERAFEKQSRAVDIDAAVARFEEHYARLAGTEAKLFPGVLEGLEALDANRIRLGVVTNKPRRFTLRLLATTGVMGLFASVVAGDDGIRRKPAGDMLEAACRQLGTMPARTLMLGDSVNDVIAARAAGCRVWCVPYGYNEGRDPETLECDRIVATVAEAARIISTEEGFA